MATLAGNLPGGGRGLRVSRPGFDPNDPNLIGNQLAFDSRFVRATKIHMVIEDNGQLQGGVNTNTVTVPFGKTFDDIPIVLSFYQQDVHPNFGHIEPFDLRFLGGTLRAYDPASTGGFVPPAQGLTTSSITITRGNYAPQMHIILDSD